MRSLFILICFALAVSLVGCKEQNPVVTKQAVEAAIKANPELVLQVLRENSETVLDIVQQGSEVKREKAMRAQMEAQLANPLQPVIEEGRIVRGNPDAPITIVEYSDFECPYCARATQTVEELMRRNPDKIRLVFKHTPLAKHKNGMIAARYFEAAALQDSAKAWMFHDVIFANRRDLTAEGESWIRKVVKDLGLNVKQLAMDVNSDAIAARIKADMEEGERFGFQGTPYFTINGVVLAGAQPLKAFEEVVGLVQAADAKAKAKAAESK